MQLAEELRNVSKACELGRLSPTHCTTNEARVGRTELSSTGVRAVGLRRGIKTRPDTAPQIRNPRTRGFVERMNRTLLDECVRLQGHRLVSRFAVLELSEPLSRGSRRIFRALDTSDTVPS
jgi:hypothetical protein